MKIRDIMTRDVEVIDSDASLKEAADKMRSLNVGSLPVVHNDSVVGMLTDRDITVRATAEGRDPNNTPVKDVVTADVVYCFEDQDVSEASDLMSRMQIRRLPILSRDKRLVGVVSLGDIATDSGHEGKPGEVLKDVSQPSRPER